MKKIIIAIAIFVFGSIVWPIYNTSKNTREYRKAAEQKPLFAASQQPNKKTDAKPSEKEPDKAPADSQNPNQPGDASAPGGTQINNPGYSINNSGYSNWSADASGGASPFPPPSVNKIGDVIQRTIHVGVRKWEWVPVKLEAEYGERVILIMHNADVAHSISIPELGVRKEISEDGAIVQWDAEKRGTFAFFCDTPCGKDHDKMKGEITIA